MPPTSASAVEAPAYNVVDRDAAKGVTADALPTVQIDGVVWDQAIVGDTVYAGGQFANARPGRRRRGDQPHAAGQPALLQHPHRRPQPRLRAQRSTWPASGPWRVSPDKSRLYVVGSFTTVNGQSRSRVAAFNVTSDGSLVATFKPMWPAPTSSPSSVSNDIAVYLGGWFGAGQRRRPPAARRRQPQHGRHARLGADRRQHGQHHDADARRLAARGRRHLRRPQRLGRHTASARWTPRRAPSTRFAANQTIKNYGNSAGIYSLKTDGTNIYGAAYWYGGTGGNFEGNFVARPRRRAPSSGSRTATATPTTPPRSAGVVYTVSHAALLRQRRRLPARPTRAADHQRAKAFTSTRRHRHGDQRQPDGYFNWGSPAPVDRSTGSPTSPPAPSPARTRPLEHRRPQRVRRHGRRVPAVNGVRQQGLVRFAIRSIAPNKQGPLLTGRRTARRPCRRHLRRHRPRLLAGQLGPRRPAAHLQALPRRPPRHRSSPRRSTPTFWNRPILGFVDTGPRRPARCYRYRVTATDPLGQHARSARLRRSRPSPTGVDAARTPSAVIADGASSLLAARRGRAAPPSTTGSASTTSTLGTGVDPRRGRGRQRLHRHRRPPSTARPPAPLPDPRRVGHRHVQRRGLVQDRPPPAAARSSASATATGNSGSYDRHVYMDNGGH